MTNDLEIFAHGVLDGEELPTFHCLVPENKKGWIGHDLVEDAAMIEEALVEEPRIASNLSLGAQITKVDIREVRQRRHCTVGVEESGQAGERERDGRSGASDRPVRALTGSLYLGRGRLGAGAGRLAACVEVWVQLRSREGR